MSVSRNQLTVVARTLKSNLNGHAFNTMPRMDLTRLVREVSGEDTTRIKSEIARQLEIALLEQGVRCYPSLATTTTGDTVRLFHAASVLATMVDLLVYPDPDTDKDLADMLTKVKGRWQWSQGLSEHLNQRSAQAESRTEAGVA